MDETKEQLAILLQYVHKGVVKERAIGTIHMKDLCAESLALFIMNKLSRFRPPDVHWAML